jgi:hypothetical protein
MAEVPRKPLQPSLMFLCNAGAYPSGAKDLPGTNDLAYLAYSCAQLSGHFITDLHVASLNPPTVHCTE